MSGFYKNKNEPILGIKFNKVLLRCAELQWMELYLVLNPELIQNRSIGVPPRSLINLFGNIK